MRQFISKKEWEIDRPPGLSMTIIEDNNHFFYGLVLYSSKTGSWSSTQNRIQMQLETQKFVALTEAEVFDQCLNWIKSNLQDAEIIPISQ